MGSKKNRMLTNGIINLLFIGLSLACVVPLLFILSASLSSKNALNNYGYTLWPVEFSTESYDYILKNPSQIINSYIVTIAVTIFGTIGSLFCTSTFAYVMARKDFKLHRLYSFLLLFTLLFSGGFVPSYIVISRYYHLKDTLLVLILPYIIIPWHVFLMKGFFMDLPMSLLEAAKMDGAREATVFFKIVVPLSKPAFATVGLFCAFTYWNDWWLSLLYIDNPLLTSLQFYLYRIMNNIQYLATASRAGNLSIDLSKLPGETARMALCVLAAGPMLFIFPFFQKHFVRGLTVGAVKG
ncbi:MAG: carbohydrate ABC transporter permease [Treponema sp.]|jgi:putative aldouronate transport system permease protein|nr:carbohydrate ABC transporter permease [Treponema sp.]